MTDAVKATSEMGRNHLMYLVVPAARLYMVSPVREEGGKGGVGIVVRNKKRVKELAAKRR